MSLPSSTDAKSYRNEITTMTLTKADLADLLFDKVGLNKREAKDMSKHSSKKSVPRSKKATPSNCQVLAISSCATNRNARAAILKPGKRFRSPLAV